MTQDDEDDRTTYIARINASLSRLKRGNNVTVIEDLEAFDTCFLVDLAELLETESARPTLPQLIEKWITTFGKSYMPRWLSSLHTHYEFLRGCNAVRNQIPDKKIAELVAGLLTLKDWSEEAYSLNIEQDRNLMLLFLAAERSEMSGELYQRDYDYGFASFLCDDDVTRFAATRDRDTVLEACRIIMEEPVTRMTEVEALLKEDASKPLVRGTL